MKKIVLVLFLYHLANFAFAQIDLNVYSPEGDSVQVFKPISIYSAPGVYFKELENKVENEKYYLVIIKEKSGNYFRVEPQHPEWNDPDYGFYGWVHTGDVYVQIHNYTDAKINLYTNPWDKIPTGYICNEKGYWAAVYDVVGNYVLVNLLPDNIVKSTNIWGWVHRCHLTGQPYTTEPGIINNIEY